MSIKLMKQRWLSEVGDARNDLNDVVSLYFSFFFYNAQFKAC